MNDIISDEQQQIEAIKNWIKDNLLWIAGFIVVACVSFFGPDAYQTYKNNKIFPASDSYEEFNSTLTIALSQIVVTEALQQNVDGLADQIIENYPDTHYAFLTSIGAAKLSAQVGSYGAAKSRLTWAADQADSEADKQLVNYRLAIVETQLGNTDAALDLLGDSNEHFAPLYAEARGDIYSIQGERDQAILSYQEALDASEENTNQSYLVGLKLTNLQSGLGSITE